MTVTKADLEAKLREIEEVVDQTRSAVKNTGVLAAVGTVAAVGASFFFGRRKGRKAAGRTRIEVFKIK